MPEQFRALYAAARRQGWKVRYDGKGHLCWEAPGGERVSTPSSPSRSPNSYMNARAKLRRAGLKV